VSMTIIRSQGLVDGKHTPGCSIACRALSMCGRSKCAEAQFKLCSNVIISDVIMHCCLCGCCRRHGISSLNNLVVLAAAVAYGWILAGRVSLGL